VDWNSERRPNRLDRRSDTFTHFCHDSTDGNSISSIRSARFTRLRVSGNELWIATSNGGLNKFDPRTNTFVHYLNVPNDPHSLSSNYISAIYEDRAGRFGSVPRAVAEQV
jgi:hypothetical protein